MDQMFVEMHVRHTHTALEIWGWKRTDQWQPSRVKTMVSFKTVQLSGLWALKVAIYRIYGKLPQCLSCVQPACPKSGWPGSLNNNKAKSVLSHELLRQATKKEQSGTLILFPTTAKTQRASMSLLQIRCNHTEHHRKRTLLVQTTFTSTGTTFS